MNAPADQWIDDDPEPPPAWLSIRLAAPLGDDAMIDVGEDDG